MARFACSRNTLLVAPTGCGKTKVISMVLDDLWRKKPSAKVFLLAETIPLVLQQTRNLKKLCTPWDQSAETPRPIVGAFGSFNPDTPILGNREAFSNFLSSHDLFVFVPAMLLNLLSSAGMQHLEGVDLLVIDEAHHAAKDHPFHEVVRQIDQSSAAAPRILAVTATCGGKPDEQMTKARLEGLAETLHNSEVFCQYDLTSEARHELEDASAKARPRQVVIDASALESWFNNRAVKLADEIRRELDEQKQQLGMDVHTKLQRFAVMLDEAVGALHDCGVFHSLAWLASEYLLLMRAAWADARSSESPERMRLLGWIEGRFCLSRLYSNLSLVEHEDFGDEIDREGYAVDAEPRKHARLLSELATMRANCAPDAFRCIVFYKTRHAVKVALRLMQAVQSHEGTGPGVPLRQQLFGLDVANKLMPRQFVGKGSRDLSESISSQEVTRQMFLEGSCNLLLTTSVADEGLDFPACNAVVLMDGADNDISLVQRRGRVRIDGGESVVFLRRDMQDKFRTLELCAEQAERALESLSLERRHARASYCTVSVNCLGTQHTIKARQLKDITKFIQETMGAHVRCTLTYRDFEGDDITLSREDEFKEAAALFQAQPSAFEVFVHEC